MAEVIVDDTAVHDVHGITHAHPNRVVGAQLFPDGTNLAVATNMTRCLLRYGTTGRHNDFGNSFSENFRVGIGTGFRCVNVQLAGWDLDFTNQDHHVDRIQVRIRNVSYNSSSGEVRFNVTGYYRDKNGDDDYHWEVWYTILGLG
jgi:hypothetical protein